MSKKTKPERDESAECEQDRIDQHVAEQQWEALKKAASEGDEAAQGALLDVDQDTDPDGGDVLFASLTYRGRPVSTIGSAKVACAVLGIGLLTGPAWESNDAANGCWNVVAKPEHVAHLLKVGHLTVIAGLFAMHAEAA